MSTSRPPDLNSKFAWRELFRRDLPRRSAEERLADFLEIHGLFDEQAAREQASRCLQCPNPSCVNGCPLCNPIPQWIALTAEGRFLEAAAVLGSVTNMAEICSRLCHQEKLCEEACVLNGVSDPVAIRSIEQFLADYAMRDGDLDVGTRPPVGQKVAVVGSGPGALACADELARCGYAVTVFDRGLVPGGLLVNGVPAFKLERSILQHRIDLLKRRGVVFHMGRTLGEDLGIEELRCQHEAVYLGFDSREQRVLDIPGSDLKGVLPGTSFMLQKNTSVDLDLSPVDVEGKRVVVIGGGDSAMVCLRTALRCRAKEALCIYRRDEPDMPCAKDDYLAAREEGVRFEFRAQPIAILGDSSGQVRGVRCLRTKPLEESISRAKRPFGLVAGSEFEIEADCVVAAIGFGPVACRHDGELAELSIHDWGGLVVDGNQRTNIQGVYAGGDIVRGPCTVLEAVRDGRNAARAMDRHLAERRAATVRNTPAG